MAFTTVGFDGSVTEAQFSRLMRYHGEVAYRHGVVSGLVTTAAAGTRQASITTGTAVLPGLLIDSDATVTTTHTANGGTANRVDYVVLQADWATNTTSIVVVPGTSATAPALTQTAGSLWQMPLARVTVRPGVTTLLASDVVVCKPLPRVVQHETGSLTPVTRAWNSAEFTVGTITMADPGWPYRLHISAAARFVGGTGFNGYANLVTIVNGTRDGEGQSEALVNTGIHTVAINRTTGIYTGPVTVLARIFPTSMTSASSLQLASAPANHFGVDQIPA